MATEELESEFFHPKKKKQSKFSQFFSPKPKTTPVTQKSKVQKQPFKLNLLSKAPVSFNLGLTYIMLIGVVIVMIGSENTIVWGICIATLYCFYRHIKLERKINQTTT